jgi:hypothetical protein
MIISFLTVKIPGIIHGLYRRTHALCNRRRQIGDNIFDIHAGGERKYLPADRKAAASDDRNITALNIITMKPDIMPK